jgi:hypothetical protein
LTLHGHFDLSPGPGGLEFCFADVAGRDCKQEKAGSRVLLAIICLDGCLVLPPTEAGVMTFLQAVDASYLCSIDGWASVRHMAMQ